MADKRNENLDELLDSLLAGYSDAQPRPGFQTRLRATLQANPGFQPSLSAQKRKLWLWAAAFSAFAAVMLAIYFALTPALPDVPKIKVANVPVPGPSETFVPPHKPMRVQKMRPPVAENGQAVAEIRQQVFPSATPLSEQEQLLLRYLARTPKEELAAQSRSDEPSEGPELLVPRVQQFLGIETHSTR